MSGAYYNEIDPLAAGWLRELIKGGHIADGEVDTRDIRDIRPSELSGFDQCHFFAGIGGWSRALRLAGWSDNRKVWTGSCPCQPFSAAGKQAGFADERHVWPAWYHLIGECRPSVIFGEQVASSLAWLDLVQADMEGAGYAFAANDLCAASVGAPHIRQRLYFVADAGRQYARRSLPRSVESAGPNDQRPSDQPRGSSDPGDMADAVFSRRPEGWTVSGLGSLTRSSELDLLVNTEHARLERLARDGGNGDQSGRFDPDATGSVAATGAACELADANGGQSGDGELQRSGRYLQQSQDAVAGFWSACDWLPCIDGKARPVEPGTFPLAHGVPARVGRLRGYGNAIVPQVAQAFIEAYMSVSE